MSEVRYVVEYRDNGMKCGEAFTVAKDALKDWDRRRSEGKTDVRVIRETLTREDITPQHKR